MKSVKIVFTNCHQRRMGFGPLLSATAPSILFVPEYDIRCRQDASEAALQKLISDVKILKDNHAAAMRVVNQFLGYHEDDYLEAGELLLKKLDKITRAAKKLYAEISAQRVDGTGDSSFWGDQLQTIDMVWHDLVQMRNCVRERIEQPDVSAQIDEMIRALCDENNAVVTRVSDWQNQQPMDRESACDLLRDITALFINAVMVSNHLSAAMKRSNAEKGMLKRMLHIAAGIRKNCKRMWHDVQCGITTSSAGLSPNGCAGDNQSNEHHQKANSDARHEVAEEPFDMEPIMEDLFDLSSCTSKDEFMKKLAELQRKLGE